MTLEDDVGLLVNWPSMGTGGGRRGFGRRGGNRGGGDPAERAKQAREEINQAFLEAIAYFKARKADPSLDVDLRYEAMADTISGKRSVFIRADNAEQIQSSIAWAMELNLEPVIIGGADAALCLDILKRNDVPVIVGGTHSLPRRRDAAFDSPFTLPKTLEEAGITWCMSTGGDSSNERNLPYQTAKAVAYGLPEDAALRSITLSAAEVLGISGAVGSLEKGKLATLIITDGNPLEMTTKVITAFVAGKQLDLSNKHTVLAEKYREKYRQMGLLPKK
jgi:imidazolonepropionase-like amidohydrolase